MTTAIVNRVQPDNGAIATADSFGRDKVELLKRTVCKDASDSELELFIHVCKRTGLDPFARQIHAVKRWQDGGQVMTIQTGIDGYRLIADRTGKYTPGREPAFSYNDQGELVAATAYVKKQTADGTWHEVCATAHFDEYVGRKRDGSPNSMWANKPHIMLGKCAEALALRRAFPAELSGVYTKEEMEQADNEESPHRQRTASSDAPEEHPDAQFTDLWLATMEARGFSLDDAQKVLYGMLRQKKKKLADLDGPARANLIALASEGKFDAYLRPQKQEQSAQPAQPSQQAAPSPPAQEQKPPAASEPAEPDLSGTHEHFVSVLAEDAMDLGVPEQALMAGLDKALKAWAKANPGKSPDDVPVDLRKQWRAAFNEGRGIFAR